MTLTWRGEPDLAVPRPSAMGLVRAIWRGVPLLLVLGSGLALMGVLRPVEWLTVHPRRPWTPWITVTVCRVALRLLGIRTQVEGRPMQGSGAFVANHSSWLDIFVLNSCAPLVFVAKSEVADWPGIGWLARATGTLFVRREARGEIVQQARALARRIRTGERPAIFPEGTSTDNRRVLPFRSALLSGLLVPGLPIGVKVQPVTLAYTGPNGQDPRFYAWYGGAEFGPHALAVLAVRGGGKVRIIFHEPIPVDGRDRKTLAMEAEARVRSAL